MEQKNCYLDLYEKTKKLDFNPHSFEEWLLKRPFYIYRELPYLLNIHKSTISKIRNGHQDISAEILKRMAIISETPTLQLIEDLYIYNISLRDKEDLREFDIQYQTFLTEKETGIIAS
ncbi:MAG: helix-turn-helix transcriptional regulator [Bacteroidales bacterium]|nr:helix-turn-helix transcriptional regulator [Bacteroidales bacterium]